MMAKSARSKALPDVAKLSKPQAKIEHMRLARRAQVIAVTHAPQVAARADKHYLITKDALARGKRVATSVSELAADRRREEIARMLAGAEITAEARAAAERLLRAATAWP